MAKFYCTTKMAFRICVSLFMIFGRTKPTIAKPALQSYTQNCEIAKHLQFKLSYQCKTLHFF